MSFSIKIEQNSKIPLLDAMLLVNKVNLQYMFIENQLLLVVYRPILIAFYLIATKLV